MAARGTPHEPQNRCPTGFSAPQLEQTTTDQSLERSLRSMLVLVY
jgi:hypothetical protein